MQIQTSDDDSEIEECLELVLDSARLGLMHESIDVNHIASYTSELLSRPAPAQTPVKGRLADYFSLPPPGSWFACKYNKRVIKEFRLVTDISSLGCNGVFAETILDLAKRKPHLIFKDNAPYEL